MWISARTFRRLCDTLDRMGNDLSALKRNLEHFTKRTESFMSKTDDDLDALVASAESEDTKIDSLIALVGTLTQPLGLNAEQQAKLERALAAIRDNPDRIQAAIDANTTPPAP